MKSTQHFKCSLCPPDKKNQCWVPHDDVEGKAKGRGSRTRCISLMAADRPVVADTLEGIIRFPGVSVPADAKWLPYGVPQKTKTAKAWDLSAAEELVLGKSKGLFSPTQDKTMLAWWLRHPRGSNKPNLDIASTCTIHGRPGIMLVEAKAHDQELHEASKPKPPPDKTNPRSIANDTHIDEAIKRSAALLQEHTRRPCAISRVLCYQMSNRFALACKLTEMGYPVVLVYLGFLKAMEMEDIGNVIENPSDWQKLVKNHSKPLFPDGIWLEDGATPWTLNGQPFIPLIRSINCPFPKFPDCPPEPQK